MTLGFRALTLLQELTNLNIPQDRVVKGYPPALHSVESRFSAYR